MNNKPLILGEILATVPEDRQNTLYINMARAIREGQIKSLRLTDRLTLLGANGKSRNVPDYALSSDMDGAQLMARYVVAPVAGTYTRAQATAMSAEQLLAAIAQQEKRRRRSAKSSKGSKNGAADLAE